MAEKIRILVGKPGLDGHDRGAKVIATAFRDAGFEVIYTGLHQTPEMIVEAAIQEDVDIVSISVLSGAHMTIFPRILELLREREASEIHVIGGGIIPPEDSEKLIAMGVGAIFGPGTPTGDAIAYVRNWWQKRAAGAQNA
ncbi:MAG: methylmalonyl-CoA mutase [Candidatus Eisenbacteria bacterium]|nr:methylmalonyl-CoA mutase [Candidatus Eisenbacteria bacterium]